MDSATINPPLLRNFPVQGPRLLRGAPPLTVFESRLSRPSLEGLTALCRSVGVDLASGLHAAFALMLARCSGEREFALSTPSPSVPALLRMSLDGPCDFAALLLRSRDEFRAARVEVQIDETPRLLFELSLVERDGRLAASAGDATGDFALRASLRAEELVLQWVHAADLFSAGMIDRFVRCFRTLLEAAIADPGRDVWRLRLIDADERRLVVEEFNATDEPYRSLPMHVLFEQQVRLTPDATALVHRDQALTYRELNARANRLAHHLRALGVDGATPVPICMRRSPELVIGLLAILKAGCAYVPVDPQYPPDRIAFMVADSGAHRVLAESRTLDALDASIAKIVVDSPETRSALLACPAEDPAPAPGFGIGALAYIIYTSGSTGRPKGVCIEHRQVAPLIGWAQKVYDADALSGVLAATSICFDLSIFELFVPLSSGGRVILVDHPLDFEGISAARGLRLVNTVPSAIRALLDEDALPDSVRIVNLAGEPLPESLVMDIYASTSAEAVYNLYGPSEDTTYSTVARIPRDEDRAPSIGRAISNGQVHVLDRHLEPVPVGVVGEVYVAGAGVTRGYWNRPDLTAERFIADPFARTPGARMYKTGDLARWTERGDLDFLGRADYQVKLRGLRIELGEIQARLLDMEALEEAVVTVHEDARGEKQLVAYIVPVEQGASEADLSRACRGFLAETLPDYMIPTVFVALKALPQTPNGKIDRAALPPPPAGIAPDYVAPVTDLQKKTARIWQDVLQQATAVGMRSDFFELGGNSLLAMRLLGRIRQEFQVVVPPKALFASSALEDFCAIVATGGESAAPPLLAATDRDAVPLSFGQEMMWLIDQLDGGSAHYNVQQRYLIDGPLDVAALRRAFDTLIHRHESLRTVVELRESGAVQRILDAPVVPFAEIDLSGRPRAEQGPAIERATREDALSPFALDSDVMLRVTLFRLDATRHELLLTVHHVATDGWSVDLTAAELGALYAAETDPSAPKLPPLPLQYVDFALWQRRWLQPEVLDEQARYWMRQLADARPVQGLPLDRPRQADLDFSAATLHTTIHPAAMRALQELCKEEQATLFMGLHAVFSILVARHAGDEDVVVGMPVANRELPELAPLIGLFTNTLPLRTHVRPGASFIDQLRESRSVMLEAVARQHMPFFELVERLKPERSLSHTPIFQIMFSLQDTGREPLRMPGLQVATLRPRVELAVVELLLEVSETPEGISLAWIYRKALFDESTMLRLSRHFDNLLRAAIAQPRLDVGRLPMLDAVELQRIASLTVSPDEVADDCLPSTFEQCVRAAPDAIAVREADVPIAFVELDRRANRCAHLLRAHGARPGDVVGILGGRGLQTIVAMLAVLKAGAICMPLDPRHGADIAARRARAADARLVLCTQPAPFGPGDAMLALVDIAVVDIASPEALDSYPDAVLQAGARRAATDTAWIAHPQSDAGAPGVPLSHGTLLELCRWHAAEFAIDATSRCALLADVCSDLAAWEVCSSLLAGACAIPFADAVRDDATALAQALREARSTHVILPDAVDATAAAACPSLRAVLRRSGLDAEPQPLPDMPGVRRAWCRGSADLGVVVAWSDTDATSEEIDAAPVLWRGRPVGSLRLHVLNEALQTQPFGAVGGLYAGSAHWPDEARHPRANAICVCDPFADGSRIKLLRTDGLARRCADGAIEYLGEARTGRRRAPPPERDKLDLARRASGGRMPAVPSTETESVLHALWARLLKRETIGVDTNFFAAGGNSLLLTRMLHAIRERLGVQLRIKDVYDHPDIRRLAASIDGRSRVADVAVPVAAKRTRSGLSTSQFRIWYLEHARGGNEHNVPLAMRLRGALDVPTLQNALDRVLARHEILRTGFLLEQDMPVQVASSDVSLPIHYRDLSGLPAADIESQAAHLAAEHVGRRFDIRHPPLVSALLLRTGAEEHLLQMNFHHLVFDGASFSIFVEELIAIHDALSSGESPDLPALPHGYFDFVEWQERWFESEEAIAHAGFWREYLEGCPEHLALPRQGGWPADEDAPSRLTLTVGSETRALLMRVAQERNGTLYSLLYGAFALLLGRLAGQEDLCIGMPVAGRHLYEANGIIGNFLNNLPVRTRWQPAQAFDAFLLDQIRNLEQVMSHQDYPFEKMLEQAPHLRGSESTPIFQVFFNMPGVDRAISSRRLSVDLQPSPEIEPKFDLTVYVEEDDGTLVFTGHYKRQRFASGVVMHMMRQYLHLLDQIARQPGLACGDYSLSPDVPEEAGRALEPGHFWQGPVHEIFRSRALARPQAVAIVENGQQWSYAELLHASQALARRLQAQGVGRGDIVAVVAARRASLVVAMLGILQSGAAFSLLNPEYPVDRVALLVDLVKPACALFAGEAAQFPTALNERLAAKVACRHLPTGKAGFLAESAEGFVAPAVGEQDLACVTFTSGTTGIPKAVAGTHLGIAGYLGWVPKWLEVTTEDRFSMLSGLGHDPIQRDVFSSLCVGATLVIPEPEDIAPHALARWLLEHRITFVHLTPAMAEILCVTDATAFPSLRIAFLTGDRLSDAIVEKLLGFNPAVRVLNSYGTTETQRATTYFEASATPARRGMVPVSEASPDTVIRVLNAQGQPCGLCEIGDVLVESHAIARGYLNDSELSAKVFIPLPDGRRRYRTGDLGCRLADGTIMLLGRKDGQVKIRGFRIEIGEIEAALRAHADVAEAAVVALERRPGDTALVAYAVPVAADGDERRLRADIADHLRATLPPYMVPATVVVLDRLPLTPNGKLDRRALPVPAWDEAVSAVAPRTGLEEIIATAWAEVLGLEKVGVEDDFFALGGHSMLMVLLLVKVQERLGPDVEIGRILSHATVAEQARALEEAGARVAS